MAPGAPPAAAVARLSSDRAADGRWNDRASAGAAIARTTSDPATTGPDAATASDDALAFPPAAGLDLSTTAGLLENLLGADGAPGAGPRLASAGGVAGAGGLVGRWREIGGVPSLAVVGRGGRTAPRIGTAAILPTEAERLVKPETDQAMGLPVSEDLWDPVEFGRLVAPPAEKDLLTGLPDGAILSTPAGALSVEELLRTDRSATPVGYAAPFVGTGAPVRLEPLDAGDKPRPTAPGPLPPGQLSIESSEFLDYDEERSIVYGRGRVVARFTKYKLTADKLMFDTRTKELQAQGNVTLTGDTEHVDAESLWFDTNTNRAELTDARGRTGPIYFLGDPKDDNGGLTTIRRVSKDETVFKRASFSTSEFPVPTIRMQAKEFTVFSGDRVFARNAVLHVRGVPVFWLPYYTRNLKEPSTWFFAGGQDGVLGYFIRAGYNFRHGSWTPSDDDDKIMVRRDSGQAHITLDYLTERGFGQDVKYKYNLGNGLHRGNFQGYHLEDTLEDVPGNSTERYKVDWWNRSKLSDELDALLNVDYVGDPDLNQDVLDRLLDQGGRQGRKSDRRALLGLEWIRDDFYAGLQMSLVDRIGRDRSSYFSEPNDGDSDFDRRFNREKSFTLAQPGVGPDGATYDKAGTYLDGRSLNSSDLDNGLVTSRYGRVSEKVQLTVASNRTRYGSLPLWHHMDLNVFDNLDKGLNTVNARDDARVRGFDLYNAVTNRLKLGDRATLLTKFGVGVGTAERDTDTYNPVIPSDALYPFVDGGQNLAFRPVGVTYIDKDTFLVGQRRMSLKDVSPEFAYGDIDSKLNYRVTDSLTAFGRLRYREGTEDTLGEFYNRLGSRTAADDLYNFRLRENFAEAGATYALIRPGVVLTAKVGENLQTRDDIVANELKQTQNLGLGYRNPSGTLTVNTGVGRQQFQQRDPSDVNQYIQNSMSYYVTGAYAPTHGRYYASSTAFFLNNRRDDPLNVADDGTQRALDSENTAVGNLTVGRKIGSKYLVEGSVQLRNARDGNGDTFLRIERDLHDAVAGLQLQLRGRRADEVGNTEQGDQSQVRFFLRVKLAAETTGAPTGSTGRSLYAANGKASAFAR